MKVEDVNDTHTKPSCPTYRQYMGAKIRPLHGSLPLCCGVWAVVGCCVVFLRERGLYLLF